MKRALLLAMIMIALVGASLGGCAFGAKTPTAGNSDGGSQSSATPPQVGTFPLLPPAPGLFQPQAAAVLGGTISSIGYLIADPFSGKFVPGVASLTGGTAVQFEKIGTEERFVTAAAQVGQTRVVIGHSLPTGSQGHGQVPFCATSDGGGAFATHDLGQLAGGRSAQLLGVAASADGSNPVLMAVGAVGRSAQNDVGDVSGTDPLVIVSPDSGKTWSTSASLPLPTGVTAAEALAVTSASGGTAFPGMLVVGAGWTDVSATGAREVGIVWQTHDEGKTWKIVSDENFAQTGRDFWPAFVAADNDTVIVAGWADSVGFVKTGSGPTRSEDFEWVAGKDGKWNVVTDGNLLAPTRSGITTALISREAGGFLWAGETYDTSAGGAFYAGQEPQKGNPSVWLFSTTDGTTWSRFDSTVSGVDAAAIVVGIAESGGRTAFFGVDRNSEEHGWVVDSASIK
ncbi:MAG: hypothetical protein P4L93_10700 [Coriobacteriia bacterium]|nr:hypothetical protein [Coriobacteriia bacterium]